MDSLGGSLPSLGDYLKMKCRWTIAAGPFRLKLAPWNVTCMWVARSTTKRALPNLII